MGAEQPQPVVCANHGDSMSYDEALLRWNCTFTGCRAALNWEELRYLQRDYPGISQFVIHEPPLSGNARQRRLGRTNVANPCAISQVS